MTRFCLYSTVAVLSLLSVVSGCAVYSPQLYSFDDKNVDSTPGLSSTVKAKPYFGGGLITIRRLDGRDTKTHPVFVKQIEMANPKVRDNLAPPRLISTTPGTHTYSVLFLFTDLSKKLVTTGMAKDLQKIHLPDNKNEYVTIKHQADLTFDGKPGLTYVIDRIWESGAKEIYFSVKECDSKETACKEVNFTTANAKTTAVPGWSSTDIE